MKTNTSMSVFNKYTDENKNVIFKKHLIDNVFWDDSKGINRNLGYENADDVNVFIPKNKNPLNCILNLLSPNMRLKSVAPDSLHFVSWLPGTM
jgi:hypothetical protein